MPHRRRRAFYLSNYPRVVGHQSDFCICIHTTNSLYNNTRSKFLEYFFLELGSFCTYSRVWCTRVESSRKGQANVDYKNHRSGRESGTYIPVLYIILELFCSIRLFLLSQSFQELLTGSTGLNCTLQFKNKIGESRINEQL